LPNPALIFSDLFAADLFRIESGLSGSKPQSLEKKSGEELEKGKKKGRRNEKWPFEFLQIFELSKS